MSKGLSYLALIVLLFSACAEKENNNKLYNVETDIRFGNKYYSILFSREGNAKIIRGTGTFFTDPFKANTSDTSAEFKIDSITLFYNNLDKFKESQVIDTVFNHTPRAEIYYDGKKVFDSYRWDEKFWNLFRNIIYKLPKGYNPFLASDNPFS